MIQDKVNNFFQFFKLDKYLFFLIAITLSFGFIILYTASASSEKLLLLQFRNLAIALIVMLVIAQIPPRILKLYSPYLMALGMILLILVYFFGSYGGGAKRWLDIGIIRFQPSEIMKIIVPIAIASILSKKNIPPRLGPVLISLLAIFLIGFLIYKQPDLGTAILIVLSGIYVLFFAGVRIQIFKNVWINLSAILSSIFGTLYLAWNYFLLPYQKQRILTMIDPESDPLGSGYHIIQSKIAIGSGGINGKGFGAGSQSQLDFLPEHSTDFIFSVLAEEMGFFGVILLLFLYGLIIYRSFQISMKSEDNFSKLLGLSLTMVFFTYVAINIAMVTGLVPVVGVPLPLVSYGGSSLLTILAIFGIVMSVNKHKLPGYLKK